MVQQASSPRLPDTPQMLGRTLKHKNGKEYFTIIFKCFSKRMHLYMYVAEVADFTYLIFMSTQNQL